AGRRVVEDEERDVGGRGGDDRDLLPVALGVGAALLRRAEVEALDERLPPASVDAAAQPGEEVDRLTAREVRPQGDVARHVGQAVVERDGCLPGVATMYPGRAG